MSDDDIRRLAEEAELTYTDTLRRFAEAVEAATITRCADVCDDIASECSNWEEGGENGSSAAQLCSWKVRALNDR